MISTLNMLVFYKTVIESDPCEAKYTISWEPACCLYCTHYKKHWCPNISHRVPPVTVKESQYHRSQTVAFLRKLSYNCAHFSVNGRKVSTAGIDPPKKLPHSKWDRRNHARLTHKRKTIHSPKALFRKTRIVLCRKYNWNCEVGLLRIPLSEQISERSKFCLNWQLWKSQTGICKSLC
jgi:hypothetical protein